MKGNSWIFFIIALFLSLSIGSCATMKAPVRPPNHPGYVYDSLVIEVQPFIKNTPYNNQLQALRTKLAEYQVAPYNQITFVVRSAVDSENKFTWWRWEISPFEQQIRQLHDPYPDDRNLVLWMGFFPGRFLDQQYLNTIGLRYDSTSMTIMGFTTTFEKRVAVMLHEVLHAIGLVDLEHRKESPINPERPTHCNNSDCVMFWIVPNKPILCGKCQLDVHRLR